MVLLFNVLSSCVISSIASSIRYILFNNSIFFVSLLFNKSCMFCCCLLLLSRLSDISCILESRWTKVSYSLSSCNLFNNILSSDTSFLAISCNWSNIPMSKNCDKIVLRSCCLFSIKFVPFDCSDIAVRQKSSNVPSKDFIFSFVPAPYWVFFLAAPVRAINSPDSII